MDLEHFTEITPTRRFNLLYIILDSIFVIFLLGLMLWKKKRATTIISLFGGVLYLLVDYGYFYLISHTRTVFINGEVASNMITFLVLTWMSLSYGITNFAFIYLLLGKDRYTKYYIFLIVMWWMMCPSIASMGGEAFITTSRTTGAYHGGMAIILVTSYIALTIYLMAQKKDLVSIIKLNLIGFFVQFGWEFALLINGIRPMNAYSIQTLIVNSCLETNLGMPLAFLIFSVFTKHYNDDLTKKVKTDEPIAVEAK